MSQHHVRHELAGVDADGDGDVIFRMASPLSAGKIEELGAEMRLEELGKSDIDCKAFEDAAEAYARAKGYFDHEDWLDNAMANVSRFCTDARDIGAEKLRFIPSENDMKIEGKN
ncbi:hypothetical protein [Croceicoccus gelatinilyticus]|uniref:hypothetical protein n=1 Tax=Croceicoccus gelatinilyticus TaxID=2835536 RepID=UPI001BCB0B5B|nr:hypothetical protein [Croceicoccus gelatinilyticus]MBS7671627.1 hypothetical protein [Croceicoccus gelatinilyticus]